MFCERCDEPRAGYAKWCGRCGAPLVRRGEAETAFALSQTDGALAWLAKWERRGELAPPFARRLAEGVRRERALLERELVDEPVPSPAPEEVVAVAFAPDAPLPAPPAPTLVEAQRDAAVAPLLLVDAGPESEAAMGLATDEESPDGLRAFVAEKLGWFVGAFLIVAGSGYFVAESWADLPGAAQKWLVLVLLSVYGAAFGALGRWLFDRRGLVAAGRTLLATGAAIAPVAAIAASELRHDGLASCFAGATVATAVFAPLLRAAALRFGAPSRLGAAALAAALPIVALGPLLPSGAFAIALDAALVLALAASLRRTPPEGRLALGLGGLYVGTVAALRLHLALPAAVAPSVPIYGALLSFALAAALEGGRAREPGEKLGFARVLALALFVPALVVAVRLPGALSAAALFGAIATARLSQRHDKPALLVGTAGLGLVAWQLSPGLVPEPAMRLYESVRSGLGYGAAVPLPRGFLSVTTLPYLAGLIVAGRRLAASHERVLGRAATAIALLLLGTSFLGGDPRAPLFASLGVFALSLVQLRRCPPVGRAPLAPALLALPAFGLSLGAFLGPLPEAAALAPLAVAALAGLGWQLGGERAAIPLRHATLGALATLLPVLLVTPTAPATLFAAAAGALLTERLVRAGSAGAVPTATALVTLFGLHAGASLGLSGFALPAGVGAIGLLLALPAPRLHAALRAPVGAAGTVVALAGAALAFASQAPAAVCLPALAAAAATTLLQARQHRSPALFALSATLLALAPAALGLAPSRALPVAAASLAALAFVDALTRRAQGALPGTLLRRQLLVPAFGLATWTLLTGVPGAPSLGLLAFAAAALARALRERRLAALAVLLGGLAGGRHLLALGVDPGVALGLSAAVAALLGVALRLAPRHVRRLAGIPAPALAVATARAVLALAAAATLATFGWGPGTRELSAPLALVSAALFTAGLSRLGAPERRAALGLSLAGRLRLGPSVFFALAIAPAIVSAAAAARRDALAAIVPAALAGLLLLAAELAATPAALRLAGRFAALGRRRREARASSLPAALGLAGLLSSLLALAVPVAWTLVPASAAPGATAAAALLPLAWLLARAGRDGLARTALILAASTAASLAAPATLEPYALAAVAAGFAALTRFARDEAPEWADALGLAAGLLASIGLAATALDPSIDAIAATLLALALALEANVSLPHRAALRAPAGLVWLLFAHAVTVALGERLATGRPQIAILAGFAPAAALLSLLWSRRAPSAAGPFVDHLLTGLFSVVGLGHTLAALVLCADFSAREAALVTFAPAILGASLARLALRHRSQGAAFGAESALVLAWIAARASGLLDDPLFGRLGAGADAVAGVVAGLAFLGLRTRVALASDAAGLHPFARPSLVAAHALPVLGLVVALARGTPLSAELAALTALHFLGVAAATRGRFAALASIACFDLALLLVFRRHGFDDPQLYGVPAGLSIVLLARLFRDDLGEDGAGKLRALGAMVLYATSAWRGLLAPEPGYALVTAALCVAGITAGLLLRVRAWLFAGTGFLVAVVLGNAVRFGLQDHRVGALWLTLLGLAVVGFMVLFTSRREELLARLATARATLAGWE